MTTAARYERIALYCETRIQPAKTQDAREMWIRLADQAWGRA